MGILPVDSNLEVFVSLGLAKVKPTIFVQSLTGSNTAFDQAVTGIRGNHHRVTRMGFGANWVITDSVGFREKVLWEGLPAILIKDEVAVGVNKLPNLKPWMNGYSVAIGFFMKY
jgi:hypothetical protein